ncbi:response regulator transcription factor [Paenibacillus turpanensis]|uniref:response regulator transcription factor n=1 Tax=Paenibacillus turpanensis TaxID=2689078 RepID=UPI00140DD1B0|nr:LuxR C-terminal-related transcriptional regulator [Paenibacillus turpanensis]
MTEQELEVLQYMALGLPNKAIARQLFISAETVKSHTRNIYAKLKVKNRIQAIEAGRRLRIIFS